MRRDVSIFKNQIVSMPVYSTTEAIHLLRRLEKYKERKIDLHMVFIDLEKTYDKVTREVFWRCFKSKDVPVTYIRVIRDIYERVKTWVRTVGGDSKHFSIKMWFTRDLRLVLFYLSW